ncbi:MAG: ATP synthase A1 subunit C [Methanobacteriales archaeon Met13]
MADAFSPDLLTIILLGAGAAALIIVLVAVRQFSQFAPFAYPNARVMARKGKLLDRKQIMDIIDAKKMEETYNLVEEIPEYKKYLDKFPFEKALDMQLAETHELIAKISPDKFKEFFEILLSRWDIKNIKNIIVAKEMGVGVEEIKDAIIPFGRLKKDVLDRLIDSENIEEISEVLKGTEYYELIENTIPLYQEKKIILTLEASFDKYYYDRWLETVSNISNEDVEVLNSLVSTQIDIINLKIILRSRVDGLEFKDIEDYIIAGGRQLSPWKLKDLLGAEKIGDILSMLEGTDYVDVLRDNIPEYEKTSSISTLEFALERYSMELGGMLYKRRPSTIGPIVDFLNKKETEINNLKVILRAKQEGLPPKMIRKMLTGGLK